MSSATLLVDGRNTIGECCFEDPRDGCLWWTDIQGCQVFSLRNESELSTFNMPDRACFVLPRENSGFVIGFPKRIVIANQELTEFETVCEIEQDLPFNRCNDADIDPEGGIVFGSMNDHPDRAHRTASGVLYRMAPSGELTRIDDGIRTSNATAFSADGNTMYFADTAVGSIRRFSLVDGMSAMTETEPLADVDIAPGLPDGSAVDSEGNCWNARVWGSCVACISADGELRSIINVPVPGPTCVCFGGRDRTRLYITSLSNRRHSDDPTPPIEAGGLFVADVETPGAAQRLCRI